MDNLKPQRNPAVRCIDWLGHMQAAIDKSNKEAEAALEAADMIALKRLFFESQKRVQVLSDGLKIMAEAGETGPRPSQDSVLAMRDVALAAIELAREVALEKKSVRSVA